MLLTAVILGLGFGALLLIDSHEWKLPVYIGGFVVFSVLASVISSLLEERRHGREPREADRH